MKVRIHPCTLDGTEDFSPENCVLQSPEYLTTKRIAQGPYTFGTQMLLNPKGDGAQNFKTEWLKHDTVLKTNGLNVYILVDPANEKRKLNDYTTMWVIGADGNRNIIVLDVIRDRFNLTERTKQLFELHAKWGTFGQNPVKEVLYEQYGMQADIQHIEEKMRLDNYRFMIRKIGGSTPKNDRIRRLIPYFEQGRIILPNSRTYTDYEGNTVDLIDIFKEQEYKAFPVCEHDDMLDALARLADPEAGIIFPKGYQPGQDIHSHGVVTVKTGNSRLDKRNKRGNMRNSHLDYLHHGSG